MFNNKIFYSVLIVSAIALLILLYVRTSAVDQKNYNSTINIIQNLQRVDAEWSAEALKTRAAINQNFDNLANILPHIRAIKTALLNSELTDTNATSKIINQRLTDLLKLLDIKEQNIERFKSGHAILRNSVRFLPTAEKELIAQAKKHKRDDLLLSTEHLLSKIYAHILLPDSDLKIPLLETIRNIHISDENAPADLSDALLRFTSHAKIILERHGITKHLLDDAISTPTDKSIYNLAKAYTQFHKERLVVVERYRLALIGYSTLLVIVVIFIGIKLRISYRALNKANISLQEVNENLEHKVSERTRKLRESQSQLVQSEKMAAIGQMVAGVAHEINTPLGYVNSNVEMIREMMGVVEEVVTDLIKSCEVTDISNSSQEILVTQLTAVWNHINKLQENDLLSESKGLLDDTKYGLNQISELIINLKDFSRMDRSKEDTFDVNDGLESTLKIAYNSYKNVAKIVKEYGKIPQILCSPSQINQVFLNIIANAAHALSNIDRPGIIKIKTGATKNYIFISIQDNGIGMSENIQARVFEPFYTTKDVGKGTGLGLSISHTIIKDHRGSIKLLSKPDVGSNFLITLPIKSDQETQPADVQPFKMIA